MPDQSSSQYPVGPHEYAELRQLELFDLRDALELGWRDFLVHPSFALMLALIYPVAGLILARILHGYSFIFLLFPLAAGFALIGPFAAMIFYDVSRRRERNAVDTSFSVAAIASSPSRGGIAILGAVLALIFLGWLSAAQSIYNSFFGYAPASSMVDFFMQATGTAKGHLFFLEMFAVGLAFAVVSLCVSVVSFPLLLDRKASATDAMLTSIRVIVRSPVTMLAWGVVVAVMLLVGALPAFLGLAIVVPVLGHATWHLYRRVLVVADGGGTDPTTEGKPFGSARRTT